MEDEFLSAMNDGVPGIVAALAADHDVGLAGENVDDLALAFIAPLRADEDRICHALQPIEDESPATLLGCRRPPRPNDRMATSGRKLVLFFPKKEGRFRFATRSRRKHVTLR